MEKPETWLGANCGRATCLLYPGVRIQGSCPASEIAAASLATSKKYRITKNRASILSSPFCTLQQRSAVIRFQIPH